MKVCNVSLGASEQDIKEFFSFSGEIEHIELQRLVILSLICFFFRNKILDVSNFNN